MLIATLSILRTFLRSAGHPFPCYCCLTTFVFTIPCVSRPSFSYPRSCFVYRVRAFPSRFPFPLRSSLNFCPRTPDLEQQMNPCELWELLQQEADLIPCVVWRTGCGQEMQLSRLKYLANATSHSFSGCTYPWVVDWYLYLGIVLFVLAKRYPLVCFQLNMSWVHILSISFSNLCS